MLRRGARRSGGVFATLLREKRTEKKVKAKKQRPRDIAASTLAASQHSDRRPHISSAFSRALTGDAKDATACLFYGAGIQHATIDTHLWMGVVKVLKAARRATGAPNTTTSTTTWQ